MIQSKQDLYYYLREDKKRNLGTYRVGVFKSIAYYLFSSDNYRAYRLLKSLRKLEYAENVLRKRGLFGKLVYYLRKWRYQRVEKNCNIVIGTNMLGYGFRLPHIMGGGIIINCNSMGNYCSANVGVVVGNNHAWNDRPIIGDNVKLSVGCKVIGGIHVGNNVIVAPNSVVVKDVPDNCVVSGVPAIIIKKDGEKFH